MKRPEFQKPAYPGNLNKLTLPDGRRWLGDESNGMPERDTPHADSHPSPDLTPKPYYVLYGGGKPNTEM